MLRNPLMYNFSKIMTIKNKKNYLNYLGIKILLFCVLSSLPVLYYTYLFPELLTGQHISLKAINYFLLGNLFSIHIKDRNKSY